MYFAGQEWDTKTIIVTAYIFFSFYVAEKEFILQMYKKKFEQNLLKLKMNQLGIFHELIHS